MNVTYPVFSYTLLMKADNNYHYGGDIPGFSVKPIASYGRTGITFPLNEVCPPTTLTLRDSRVVLKISSYT